MMAQGSWCYTSWSIWKASRASQPWWGWGRDLGSWGNCQLTNSERSCLIPHAVDRLRRVWRYIGDVWEDGQLSYEATTVLAEVPQKATKWERCLNFAKHLGIYLCWYGTFCLLLLSSFPFRFVCKLERFLLAMASMCRHTGLVWI